MRFLHDVNIDFLTRRKIFYILSSVLLVIGLATFIIKGITLGIDFRGGTEVLVRFSNNIDIQAVRSAMDNSGLIGSEIKTMGDEKDILIKTAQEGEGTSVAETIKAGLN